MKRRNYKEGEKRIIKRFAFFPIWTPTETRWFEWVTPEQMRKSNSYEEYWVNVKFINQASRKIKK